MPVKLPSSEQFLYAANVLCEKLFFRRNADYKSILIVKLDEIGDMATSTHVFELLKNAYPDAEMDVLCKPFVKSLIENDPHIRRIFTDLNDWNKRYDLVIELRGNRKTLMKAFRFRPYRRLSRAMVRWRHRSAQLHETDTNFEVVKPVLKPGTENIEPKLFFSENDKSFVDGFIQKQGISNIALIHAGARRKLRQWNPERFAEMANSLNSNYHKKVIFIGTEDERKDFENIAKHLDFKPIDGMGVFSLSQLSYLCSIADFYLGNESGPLQIAAVFHTPLIALYGPGVPYVFYPRHEKARVIHHILDCNPCDQVHCVRPDDPCISMITSAEVLLNMKEILQD